VSFSALVNAIEEDTSVDGVPGLCCGRDGAVIVADPVDPPHDLDALPFPARDLLDPSHYYYVLGRRSTFTTLISSRGCPFRCIFCSTPHGGHRTRSPGDIVDELEQCLANGAQEFHFVDDTFNVVPGRLEAVSREILKRGLSIRWAVRARADHIDEAAIRLAKEAGCTRIHFGIETATDEGLSTLRKGITMAQVENALTWTRRCGMTTAAYFLIGCPHERTRDDVEKTIAFACRLDPDFAMFNILTIYPHTELCDMAVARGLVGPDYWTDFVRDPTPEFTMRFWEEHLGRDELAELLQTAYRKFYLRPGPILRNLRSLGGLEDLKHKVAAGLALVSRRRV
jgi:radical SAM superfamily enzyme YgiQ (UPF0313 family)